MKFDFKPENIDENIREAEELIEKMHAESGMILVYETRAGHERIFRTETTNDPAGDSKRILKEIVTDGAVRVVPISIRLPEDIEDDYVQAMMEESKRYRVLLPDFLKKTTDEYGDFVMSAREGQMEMTALFG